MDKNHKEPQPAEPRRPEYQPPEVTTYTEEDILDELGPAQTLESSMGINPFDF